MSILADPPEARKARGAFFTPPEICRHMAAWALRTAQDTVLEPSCGEAAFLLAAGARQAELGTERGALRGVELHADSATSAATVLQAAGLIAQVDVGDFFTFSPDDRKFDVVLGNPPYVRYQDFSGLARARSREAALRAGVNLTALASSWAAFTVHAALFLKPGGRLGLVLPAELLSVNYASEVRRFLMASFIKVELVLFTERVFPGVQEEVVLLMAEGYQQGGTDHCELRQVQDAEGLAASDTERQHWRPSSTAAKWLSALLPADAWDVYASSIASAGLSTLHSWGETSLGMVTGNNKYFALSPARVRELGLADSDVLALSPPGSRHLRDLSLTGHALHRLGEDGARTLLFRPSGQPSAAARAYIAQGVRDGVDLAYKCRIRKEWWRVPLVDVPDLFLTYMNADTPRLTTNRTGARHLNSVHGVYLSDATRVVGKKSLPLASLNTLTMLGAEMVGRSYGGGMLKLEPKEADHLPVPSHALVVEVSADLARKRSQVLKFLGEGRLLDAARIVDDVVLVDAMGFTRERVQSLETSHRFLWNRRLARGGKSPIES